VKILWVKPGKLLPLDTGGKLRTYNILRHLSAAHEVTYLSYYDGIPDETYEREIVQHVPGTVPLCTSVPEARGLARSFDYVRRLPSLIPYSVKKYAFPQVQQILVGWISARSFDVAVCDFLCSAPNFPESLKTPTVLFQHNVETVLWDRKARLEARWADRMVARIESVKMARYESAQVRRFHHVLAVSERDRQAMSWMVDPSHISIVPTGVDLSQYQYDPEWQAAAPLVVFTGSMDWGPNIDGVEHFCKDIWPHVLAAVPEARFRIVGRDPHTRVRRLASESVEVTGTVPSIVQHLREAAVLVVPLRIGGGTRIKIYEGMAMGKATVSTSVGAEGLDVHHERDILLADVPERFAEYVVSLLRDRQMRQEYETAAAATARRYDWSVITDRFVEVIAQFARSGGSDPPGREAALLSGAQR
jgi:glycosyltransferase involved in cell wall biosynthesis